MEIGQIPEIGRERAELIFRQGYNRLWKLARASQEELGKLPGIGPARAKTLKENVELLFTPPKDVDEEDALAQEWECPECQTITSLFATECYDCGTRFDEEFLGEDTRLELLQDERKSLLSFCDLSLAEAPSNHPLWYARAVLLLDMGEFDEARKSFKKVVELGPDTRGALRAKAKLTYVERGIKAPKVILKKLQEKRAKEEVRQEEEEETTPAETAVAAREKTEEKKTVEVKIYYPGESKYGGTRLIFLSVILIGVLVLAIPLFREFPSPRGELVMAAGFVLLVMGGIGVIIGPGREQAAVQRQADRLVAGVTRKNTK